LIAPSARNAWQLKDRRAYLDYNATAPLRPEARAAMLEALATVGNPSSIHAEGRAARALIENARRSVAKLVGVSPRAITFTSGGTEAVVTALSPDIAASGFAGPARKLILSAGEHVAALAGHRFPPEAVAVAPLSPDGRIDLAALAALIGDEPAVVALQAANNETGVLQPVAEAAELVHARGGLLVCDAAQLAGRVPVEAEALGADALIVSAHKFGGPQGAGALIAVRPDFRVLAPLLRGGGQERRARAGTENVAAIAGFGAAAAAAAADVLREAQRLAGLRDRLEFLARGAARDVVVFGEGAPRLPNTLCFSAPKFEAQTLLMRLDLAGVAASSGSACSSGKVAPSHVLAAMGVAPEISRGALRLSLGWATTDDDVERFGEVFAATARALRR
jgi:cysteine desulfurase